jgi:hypothetical protein
MADSKSKFVILRGIKEGNRFFTENTGDVTKLNDGTVAYTILGYADTSEEAQIALYGRSFTATPLPANHDHDKPFCDCALCVEEIRARDEDYAIQQYDQDMAERERDEQDEKAQEAEQ